MAEETQRTTAEEVVVVADVLSPTGNEKEKDLPPLPEPEKPAVVEEAVAEEVKEKPKAEEGEAETEEEKKKEEEEEKMPQSASFTEESNVVSELPQSQKKALDELKSLVQVALNNHEFSASLSLSHPTKEEQEKPSEPQPQPPVQKDEKEEGESQEEHKLPQEPPKPEEPAKPEEPPVVETSLPAPTETAVVEEVVVEEKKAAEVDEDGAKTVEAIKETIVEVTPPKEPQEAPAEPKEEPKVEADPKAEAQAEAVAPPPPEEIFIWGIPILGDEKSDVILLKFLRARDFKVKDAFTMIKNAVRWRKEFGIEELLEQDLGSDLEKVVYMHGFDKENHPVCYNVYGEFQNKELYHNTFSDDEKRKKFLKWRIQFLEKSIRKLDFSPTGVCTIVQVNDLKNFPGFSKWELRQATRQALQLLQDNYPEFVAKQVFINVPWWYLAFNKMISPFLTQRTKSKFVFASPARSAETLFKYMAPEQVPVPYGGLSSEGEQEFTIADPATEFTIKPASKHTVEFPVSETSVLVWEVRVVGWDVTYGAEFMPSAEDSYTVIVQKARKIGPADETIISSNFKISEPGKVVLTFDNQSSKKKKLLHRSKTKPCLD